MTSNYYLSFVKERFNTEFDRNNKIEEKSYKMLILSTALLPIIQYMNFDFGWIIMSPTIIITILYLKIIKLNTFRTPLNIKSYFSNDKLVDKMFEKYSKKNDEDIKNNLIKNYLKATYLNEKIVLDKIKFVTIIQYIVPIQIILLIILFIIHIF